MSEEPTQQPFRRTFAVFGWICLGALAAVGLAALAGLSSPAILAFDTAALLAGGALIVLSLMVPLAFFALHRYTQAARQELTSITAEAHTELHAAHDTLLQETRTIGQLNETMHAADRDQMKSISRRLLDMALDVQRYAPALELDALRAEVKSNHEQIETAQEAQWVGHTHSHLEADKAHEAQQQRTSEALAALDQRVAEVHDDLSQLREEFEGASQQSERALRQHQAATDTLRQSLQMAHKEWEGKLARWQAPDRQMQTWADRIHDRTDHELRRFRHRIQNQLNAFETREIEDVNEASRHTREEVAMLAEDLVRGRMKQLDEQWAEKMAAYKADLDEQFATFLAGQQAQRTETEARLAAIGATRGVKVESSQAFELTSHAPFGQVYPITDVEGIGNKTAYTMQAMGILDTEHLWHADVQELANRLAITPRQVRQWQTQCELMAVDGIGPQWGEALAASGVVSISHLANLHGRELMELIQAKGHARRSELHKGVIGLAKAEEFIKGAREHKPERVVHI